MDNSSDYTLGIQELVKRYEGMVANHTPIYFDSLELVSIHEYYLVEERIEEADAVIAMAWSLYPTNTDIALIYSDSLMDAGKIKDAYEILFSEALELVEEVRVQRGEILLRMNQKEKAEIEFEEAAIASNYNVDTLIDIINIYNKTVYAEKGSKFANLLEEKHPLKELMRVNGEVRDALSNHYMLTKESKKSYEIAKIETELEPYSHEAWADLAISLAVEGRYEEAIEAADFALAIEPDDENLEMIKLTILSDAGRHGEMDHYLIRQIRENQENMVPAFLLIEHAIELKNYHEAYEYGRYFLKKLKMNADDLFNLHLKISMCAVLNKEERTAHKHALLAMKLNHHSPAAYCHYAWCWLSFKKANHEMANNFFNLALLHTDAESKDATRNDIAKTYFDKGFFSKAVEYLDKIMEVNSIEKVKAYPYAIYANFIAGNLEETYSLLQQLREDIPAIFLRLDEVLSIIDKHKLTDAICLLRDAVERRTTPE